LHGDLDIDFFRLVRKRWPLLLFGLLVGSGIAAAYQLNARHIFESQMEVLVGQRTSELATSGTSLTSSIDAAVLREDSLSTHMELLQSPKILNAAIKKGELEKLDSFIAARSDDTLPLKHLKENLRVSRGGEGAAKQASVLRATFRDPSPEGSAKVLQSIYDCYESYVKSQTKDVGEEAAKLIRDAQVTNEEELKNALEEYRLFVSTASGILQGEELQSVHHDRLIAIEKELTEIRSARASASSRQQLITDHLVASKSAQMSDLERLALLSEKEVERLRLFMDVSRGEIQSEQFQSEQPLRSEAARTEYNTLLSLILKEKSLLADFSEDHPLVASTRQEIAEIRRFIKENTPRDVKDTPQKKMSATEMLSAYGGLLRNDIAEMTKRETNLVQEAEKERVLAKGVEAEFLKGKALKARVDRAQERYDEVMQRLQEIELSTHYAGFSTDLLSVPVAPDKKAWPKALIVMALGVLGGCLLGGGLSIWAELTDHTFRDPRDLQESLQTHVLAHVPRFLVSRKDKQDAATKGCSPVLKVLHNPKALESEVFRMARTSLLYQAKRFDQKVFLVTSPVPGDGKSTVVANLAVSIAQAGKKVVLIDGDLRRPTLHRVLGVGAKTGLAEVLSGEASGSDVPLATPEPQLQFIPHGSDCSQPAELLESYAFERLVGECREQYDIVLIDSPPLLAVADPVIMGEVVDGVLLIVRIQRNGRRPVERAREILHAANIPLIGCIVNGSRPGESNFGYGNYVESYEYGYPRAYASAYRTKEKGPPEQPAVKVVAQK
jgi:capsular exopolysaccharide synthesis family protein